MMGLWGYGYTPCVGNGLIGFVLMIFFWIFIIWVAILMVRGGMHGAFQNGYRKSSAIRILEERYAKGEIDKKELEEKIKDLTNK